MKLNYGDVVALAKSVTELAIQKDLINTHSKSNETATEIANFYTTFVNKVINADD